MPLFTKTGVRFSRGVVSLLMIFPLYAEGRTFYAELCQQAVTHALLQRPDLHNEMVDAYYTLQNKLRDKKIGLETYMSRLRGLAEKQGIKTKKVRGTQNFEVIPLEADGDILNRIAWMVRETYGAQLLFRDDVITLDISGHYTGFDRVVSVPHRTVIRGPEDDLFHEIVHVHHETLGLIRGPHLLSGGVFADGDAVYAQVPFSELGATAFSLRLLTLRASDDFIDTDYRLRLLLSLGEEIEILSDLTTRVHPALAELKEVLEHAEGVNHLLLFPMTMLEEGSAAERDPRFQHLRGQRRLDLQYTNAEKTNWVKMPFALPTLQAELKAWEGVRQARVAFLRPAGSGAPDMKRFFELLEQELALQRRFFPSVREEALRRTNALLALTSALEEALTKMDNFLAKGIATPDRRQELIKQGRELHNLFTRAPLYP